MSEIAGRSASGVREDDEPIHIPEEFDQPSGIQPTEDVSRWLRRHFAAGVTVITAGSTEAYSGVTVSSFAFVSLEPLLVLAALGIESATGEVIRRTRAFGVSLLTNRHRFLADRFAGQAPLVDRRFSDVAHVLAVTGAPLLSDAIAWLDCRLETEHPGGDHRVFLGRVAATGRGSGDATDPLLYFQSQYRRLR